MLAFRAAEETYLSGNDVVAKNPTMLHDYYVMRAHIQNGSQSNAPKNDPYISLTEDICVMAYKYVYGKRKDKDGNYRYSKKRAKALLVELDEGDFEPDANVMSNVEYDENGEPTRTFYYTGASKDFPISNYSPADREVIAYAKIDKSRVHEIHPLLVDMLIALDQSKSLSKDAQEVYDGVIAGIISGKYNVEMIEQMTQEFKMKRIEREFIEEYYKNRTNIVDSYDKTLPERKLEGIEDRMFEGTCLRVQIIKDLLPQFIEREFPDKSHTWVQEFRMPLEEHVSASNTVGNKSHFVCQGNIHMELMAGERKEMAYGMNIRYDYLGNLVGLECESKGVKKQKATRGDGEVSPTEYPAVDRKTVKKQNLLQGSKYTSIDLNDEYARGQREYDINNSENKPNLIENTQDEYWAYDEDGYCIRCKGIRENDEKLRFEIIDYEKDEKGNRTKFDNGGKGFNKDGRDPKGYDREGYNPKGYDREGYDREGYNYQGYDREGYGRDGYNAKGYNRAGYDRKGYNRKGYDEKGELRTDFNEAGFPLALVGGGKEHLSEITEEEVREVLRSLMKKEGGEPSKSFLNNLLSSLVSRSITTTGIYVGGTGRQKEDLSDTERLVNESKDRFYKEILVDMGIAETKDSREIVDKMIQASIEVGAEFEIDMKELFTRDIAQRIQKNASRNVDAEKALKKAKDILSGKTKDVIPTTGEREQIRRAQLGSRRFAQRYGVKFKDDNGER